MVVLMANRNELYAKFGPMLLESIIKITIEDLNRIRAHVGMQPITEQMFMDQINNDLSHLEPYNWMEAE